MSLPRWLMLGVSFVFFCSCLESIQAFQQLLPYSRPSLSKAIKRQQGYLSVSLRFWGEPSSSSEEEDEGNHLLGIHDTPSTSPSLSTIKKPTMVKDVLALDFDGVICNRQGVICNSQGESCVTAFKSVRKLWPQLATYCSPGGGPNEIPQWLADSVKELRPLVETGYENILLTRMCIELYLAGSGSTAHIAIPDIATKWNQGLRTLLLQRYGVTAQDLVDLFGSVRDEWLESDPMSWVKTNQFYAGTDLSLKCTSLEPYIITTKQTRFVEVLLQSKGIHFPRGRIFGLGSGAKTDVLARLVRLHREKASEDQDMEREPIVHFVEDRVETLEKVCADPRLQNVRLYFADWGYSTLEQKARAFLNPRIKTIDLTDFACMCRTLNPAKEVFGCFPCTCKNPTISPERMVFSPENQPICSSASTADETEENAEFL